MTNIVAVIPARGGSKGLPGKNVIDLCGKPLIAYSIEVAKASKHIDKVVVSTDDAKIAEVSREYGAEIIDRPEELATDLATTESALQHAVEYLEEKMNYKPDIVVFFQLTDFFKHTEWVDEAIEALLKDPKVDSAFVGCKSFKNYWKKENGKWVRSSPFSAYMARQKKEAIGEYVVREDTGLGCATRAHIIKSGKRIGENNVVIEKNYEFFDIHTAFDLKILEQVIKEKMN